MQNEAFFLQDVIACRESGARQLKSLFYKRPFEFINQENWYSFCMVWFVHIRPYGMKAMSILFGIASATVIWSESTFQITGATLSIPQLILNNGVVSYMTMEVSSIDVDCIPLFRLLYVHLRISTSFENQSARFLPDGA